MGNSASASCEQLDCLKIRVCTNLETIQLLTCDCTAYCTTSKDEHSTKSTSKSVSTCANPSTSGIHHFEIRNYSSTKGRGIGTAIYSRFFYVKRGHLWRIVCYLDGYDKQSSGYISVFLEHSHICNDCATTTAKFSFSLLDHTTGAEIYRKETSNQFCRKRSTYGWPTFLKRQILDESSALKDDSFTIICNVTVLAEPQTSLAVHVPHTVDPFNFFKAYEAHKSGEKVADIIFKVDGKSFSANSTVVASSSSQLSNLIKDSKAKKIKVRDVKAPVFEALLEYIYTEDLPENEKLISTGMVPNLLVAAERFGMYKLKTRCERQLSDGLDAQNVCTVLVLAEQCHLIKLKDACLGYLSTPEALVPAMATEGFISLVQKYPSIAKEISSKVKFQKIYF